MDVGARENGDGEAVTAGPPAHERHHVRERLARRHRRPGPSRAVPRPVRRLHHGARDERARLQATVATGEAQDIQGEMIAADIDTVATSLNESKNIIIVPGYGMAVAQAQSSVSELTLRLRNKKKNVRFAIHPVAGRLPGHMNVLLAEAKVPYDIVLEMDEINADYPETNVVLILGANDIVNPAAQDDPNSPIAGMPVLEVWKAEQVYIFKRGQGKGYSGIENPLFFKENSRMIYGDAKKSLDDILQKVT